MRKKLKKQDGWYRKKFYPHLDNSVPFNEAKNIVTDPLKVAQWSFLPFIGYFDSKRTYNPKRPTKYIRKKNKKIRDLKYCSHRDGYIHSYYGYLLTIKYEKHLKLKTFNNTIVGYRAGFGTNINLAKNVFDQIKKRETCVVLSFDISDFFPSISHLILLQNIKRILKTEKLSDDWFAVYKSMTRYAYVEKEALEKLVGWSNHNKNSKRYCSSEKYRELRKENHDLVKVNKVRYGIPQGSPLSALFSNIVMLDFDESIYNLSQNPKINGHYQRYSDDIIFVCDKSNKEEVESRIKNEITKLGSKTKINEDKTEVSFFEKNNKGVIACDRPLTYLGLTFTGSKTYLRTKTLSRYYRPMTYATRSAVRIAKKSKNSPYKRTLYEDFTHLGRANFYTYAKKASETLNEDTPKKQLRKHLKILNRKLNEKS